MQIDVLRGVAGRALDGRPGRARLALLQHGRPPQSEDPYLMRPATR